MSLPPASVSPPVGDATLVACYSYLSDGIVATLAWDLNDDGVTDSTAEKPDLHVLDARRRHGHPDRDQRPPGFGNQRTCALVAAWHGTMSRRAGSSSGFFHGEQLVIVLHALEAMIPSGLERELTSIIGQLPGNP